MILQRLLSVLVLTCSICLSSCPGTLEMRNAKKSKALPLKREGMKSGSYQRSPLHLKITHNVTLAVSLAVGSPPQTVTMVLDTGSELSYLRCTGTQISQPFFYPNRSPSYSPVSCSSPDCTPRPQQSSITPSCSSSNNCTAGVFFVDLGSVDTSLAKDTISIAGSNFNDTVFGCMDLGSSSNSGEDSKTTGLMGMNLGSLSFVSQMGFDKFSYCISSSDNSGLLVLGDPGFSRAKPLNYTPLVRSNRYRSLPNYNPVAYTVNLTGIKVSDKLAVNQSAFTITENGAGQTIVDSGSQFTFLRGQAYTALKEEFLNQTKGILKEIPGKNFQALDLCFSIESNQTKPLKLPSVTLLLEGTEFEIPGNRLLYQVPGDDSVHCFTFGNCQGLQSDSETSIIGHYHQQDLWVEYDLANSQIGFARYRLNKN